MSLMPIVVVGHVDHGKSTVVGRLLADTGALPDGKLEQVRELCRRTSKPFEYAFLLDALKAERDQGITIDTARVFFASATRRYVVLDAPGHVEFLRNMITGASRAEAALLVIDAREGVRENTRRHATMLAMLGVAHVAVVVNKLDLVNWSRDVFAAVSGEISEFLTRVGLTPAAVVPASGLLGSNLSTRASETPWYEGPTVLEVLDACPAAPPLSDAPLRLPVQDVYRFTRYGDDRRIVAGTIDSGTVSIGDTLVFYPSGKRSRVASIERFNAPVATTVSAAMAAGITLDEQIYTSRGEIATRADEPAPIVSTRFRASVFWLGQTPLAVGRDYHLRLGTARVPMRVESVERVIDASTLDVTPRPDVGRHDVAEVVLKLDRAVAFDRYADLAATGRFVIVDQHEIRGGGVVREPLVDGEEAARGRVRLRNQKWEHSRITPDDRAARASQRPTLVLVTGERETDRKGLAKQLEARLFASGRAVYYLGMANMLYGVDADIDRTRATRHEHFRRLGEIAHLMLDAGLVFVVSAAELAPDDLEIVKVSVPAEQVRVVWVGAAHGAHVACDLVVVDDDPDVACAAIEAMLVAQGAVPRP